MEPLEAFYTIGYSEDSLLEVMHEKFHLQHQLDTQHADTLVAETGLRTASRMLVQQSKQIEGLELQLAKVRGMVESLIEAKHQSEIARSTNCRIAITAMENMIENIIENMQECLQNLYELFFSMPSLECANSMIHNL